MYYDAAFARARAICYSHIPVLQFSYDTAYACGPGDLAEVGVAAGAQVIMAAAGLLDAGKINRKVWCFDSFQGISMASAKDDVQPGIGLASSTEMDPLVLAKSSGVTVHSLECVKDHIKAARLPLEMFVFVPGWLEHTLKTAPTIPNGLAWLRLDVDMYWPTAIAIDKLLPLVNPGGTVIIDDYVLKGCRQAVEERIKDRQFIPIDGSGPVYFKT